MKDYAPYLLYQVARFGALTVPQMQRICQGKCGRSSLYRAISKLAEGDFVYPILNPATRTRAYYATREGRESVFGKTEPLTTGVRAKELDHTIQAAEVLLELCLYENVTGVTTQFEMSAEDVKRFCYQRVPDGVIRLTQNGEHYELAVEIESTVRNSQRIADVLERYWQTCRRGMECYGLLIVAMTPTIFAMYTKAIERMPPEFKTRVRLLQGPSLFGITYEAFGKKTETLSRCLDLTRTQFADAITYSPVKAGLFLAQAGYTAPTPMGVGQQTTLEINA